MQMDGWMGGWMVGWEGRERDREESHSPLGLIFLKHSLSESSANLMASVMKYGFGIHY